MPNVSLAAGRPGRCRLDDLIAATDDGISSAATARWSIDHQRYNFQFGGQTFYEVKNGKIAARCATSRTRRTRSQFWKAATCSAARRPGSSARPFDDGKGEPKQSNAVSHGCPPARFRGVSILNTKEKKL